MIDRSALTVGMVILLSGLLSPAAAFASVKCQCNNGMIAEAMDADYDDDNANESCNDACSDMGGGRVWNAETDQDEGDDVTIGGRERRHEEPRHRR